MLRIFVKTCVRIFTLIVFRVKTYGQENIKNDEAYIMCANHTSNWDPPILYTATKREMYMMAKEDQYIPCKKRKTRYRINEKIFKSFRR